MNKEYIRTELLSLVSDKLLNVKLSDTGVPKMVEIIIRYPNADVRLNAEFKQEKSSSAAD